MMTLIHTKNNDPYGVKTYLADSVAAQEASQEIWPSNCAPGSRIYAIDTGKVYILNNNYKWTVYQQSSSGGSSGSSGNDDDLIINVDGGIITP